MTSARGLHLHWLAEAERHAALKKAREAGLKDYARRKPWQGPGKPNEADLTHIANGLMAKDTLVLEHETMRQRAEQTAIMYGIAALLDAAAESGGAS